MPERTAFYFMAVKMWSPGDEEHADVALKGLVESVFFGTAQIYRLGEDGEIITVKP